MIEGEAVKAKAGRNGGKNKVFADGQQGLPPPVPRGYAGSPAYSFVTSDVIELSATNLARCCYDGQKPGPLENKILSCVCPVDLPLDLSVAPGQLYRCTHRVIVGGQMLGEALQLPDHAVPGSLEPEIEALGSMVTNQAGKGLGERDRLIQFRSAAAQVRQQRVGLLTAFFHPAQHQPRGRAGRQHLLGCRAQYPPRSLRRWMSPKLSLCRTQALKIARERGVAAPVAVLLLQPAEQPTAVAMPALPMIAHDLPPPINLAATAVAAAFPLGKLFVVQVAEHSRAANAKVTSNGQLRPTLTT